MQISPIITFTPIFDSYDHISPTFKKKTPKNLKTFEQSPRTKISNSFEQSPKIHLPNPEKTLKSPSSSPKNQKNARTSLKIAIKPLKISLKRADVRKSSQIQIKQQIKNERSLTIKSVKKSSKMKPLFRFKELLEITDIWVKSEAFYIESKKMAKNVTFSYLKTNKFK